MKTSRAVLADYLRLIEIREADCPSLDDGTIRPECVQCLQHHLTCQEWAELLCSLRPGEYRQRAPPPAGEEVLTHEARIAVYAHRAALGLALFHPGDAFRRGAKVRAAITVGRGKNGSVIETGVTPD